MKKRRIRVENFVSPCGLGQVAEEFARDLERVACRREKLQLAR